VPRPPRVPPAIPRSSSNSISNTDLLGGAGWPGEEEAAAEEGFLAGAGVAAGEGGLREVWMADTQRGGAGGRKIGEGVGVKCPWERDAAECSAACADWGALLAEGDAGVEDAGRVAAGLMQGMGDGREGKVGREGEREEGGGTEGDGEEMSVTLVVAAINAQRPRHYTAGDSSFRGDYLWSLKQVALLPIPRLLLGCPPSYSSFAFRLPSFLFLVCF